MSDHVEDLYKRMADPTLDTRTRMQMFAREDLSLTPLDNYGPTDTAFDQAWHRWFYLYQCATGVERAAAIQVAAEMFRSNPPNATVMTGTEGLFTHGISDATRNWYIAKAMCVMYQDLIKGG